MKFARWVSRPGPTCGPYCGCCDPDPEPTEEPMTSITRVGVLEIYDTGDRVLPWGVRRAGDVHPVVAFSERALALAFARDHAKEYGRV